MPFDSLPLDTTTALQAPGAVTQLTGCMICHKSMWLCGYDLAAIYEKFIQYFLSAGTTQAYFSGFDRHGVTKHKEGL